MEPDVLFPGVPYDYAAVAREASLLPRVIDVAAFSVQNAFELNYQTAGGETVVLINIGAAISNINIVKDGMSAFTRDVTIGGNAFTEEIQKQLNVSHDEAEGALAGKAVAGVRARTEAEVQHVVRACAELEAASHPVPRTRSRSVLRGH